MMKSGQDSGHLESRLSRTQGLLLSVSILAVALAVALVVVMRRESTSSLDKATFNEDVRREAVAALVERSLGVWDSFPDPDVGRILQPNLRGREDENTVIFGNRFGMREHEFAVPKPPDVTRIVLLGDSFVFGAGVDAQDRLGVFLEEFIRRRMGVSGSVECLHIGLGSWNIQAETAYMRRNLSSFDPDLVIQVLVSNDLNDSGSVRGFGVVADFTSQHRERTVSIYHTYPAWALKIGPTTLSYLNRGLGFESRSRYAEAAERLAKLADHLRRRGAEYLMVLSWEDSPQVAARFLTTGLPAQAVAYLPNSFRLDSRYRISSSNPHWNKAGHERVAEFLYGAILEREFLPKLELADWPKARRVFRSLDGEGRADARAPLNLSTLGRDLRSTIDFQSLDEQTASQIYGGIDRYGHVSPYASVLLARKGGQALHLVGACLLRRELDGAQVRLYLDELEVASISLETGKSIDLTIDLPEEIRRRRTFDLRFEAEDWVYRGAGLRDCTVFDLRSVAVVP